jgi:AbrB family transcriptional regulator, stage V sporulation protein T
VISGGKIVIPAELRRELGIVDGDELVIERDHGGLVIKTYAQVVREVQAEFRAMRAGQPRFTVDDFLAERCAEAAREDASTEARSKARPE